MLAAATEEALAIRGVVMLEVDGDPRRWCAVCASVQGDLEARVGEPRRGLRVWRQSAGERWLAEHGFTHRLDAWVRPATSREDCVAVLDAALEHGLGVAPGSELRRGLVVRGVPDAVAAPAPDAEPAEHLAAALGEVVAGRARAMDVECGRPARPLAWAYMDGEALVVEVQSTGPPGDHVELGRFDGAPEAAQRLGQRLAGDFGCSGGEPLFVSLIAD